MVNVYFYTYLNRVLSSRMDGLKCTLDGVTQETRDGRALFYSVTGVEHEFSVTKEGLEIGLRFVEARDFYYRPLLESGVTRIENPLTTPPSPWTQPTWFLYFFYVEEAAELGEFRFDSWNPGALDFREIFVVGAAWPATVRPLSAGEDVYAHYVVKNVGTSRGEATIIVKDLDTGAVVKMWNVPALDPMDRFKTASPGSLIGKMPSKDWPLEFKVLP